VAAVRRIVVGVHGSLGSLQALRYAAEEARARKVPLVPVIAWIPPGGDMAERTHPSPYLRPVLAVPPSALMDEIGHGFRPWSLRGRRVLTPDISELTDH
jgi:hypothetical protein